MADTYLSKNIFHHHCNGTDGEQSSCDTIGNALVPLGTAPLISTTQSKFGSSSLKFIGTGGFDITPPSILNSRFDFGTGDLTIEGWIYPTGSGYVLFSCQKTTNFLSFYLDSSTSGRLTLANTNVITGVVFTANAWQHLAITRSGNTWRVFVNGTQAGSTTNSSAYSCTSNCYLGCYNSGTYSFNGYMDEIRIKKGVALYTANFTPSDAPFDDTYPSISYISNLNYMRSRPSLIDFSTFSPQRVFNPALQVSQIIKNLDEQDGGTKKVTGYVTFNQQPASRLVHLLVAQDKRWIAATWSDPITGYYEFINLKDIPYLVLSEDYTNTYDLVAHFVENQS